MINRADIIRAVKRIRTEATLDAAIDIAIQDLVKPVKSEEVWMYYETDGDAGNYAIRLFTSREKAQAHKKRVGSSYGDIDEVVVF